MSRSNGVSPSRCVSMTSAGGAVVSSACTGRAGAEGSCPPAGAAGKAISLADETSALAVEPIEKFIGQKILVEWAGDDLYLAEIKPTSEERRRYADEKRQRMALQPRTADRGHRKGKK